MPVSICTLSKIKNVLMLEVYMIQLPPPPPHIDLILIINLKCYFKDQASLNQPISEL